MYSAKQSTYSFFEIEHARLSVLNRSYLSTSLGTPVRQLLRINIEDLNVTALVEKKENNLGKQSHGMIERNPIVA